MQKLTWSVGRRVWVQKAVGRNRTVQTFLEKLGSYSLQAELEDKLAVLDEGDVIPDEAWNWTDGLSDWAYDFWDEKGEPSPLYTKKQKSYNLPVKIEFTLTISPVKHEGPHPVDKLLANPPEEIKERAEVYRKEMERLAKREGEAEAARKKAKERRKKINKKLMDMGISTEDLREIVAMVQEEDEEKEYL